MNIAHRITDIVKRNPSKKAVVFPLKRHRDGSYTYHHYTYQQFDERSNQIANGLVKAGIKKGMKTLVFVKPCLDFSAITFALFKIGAVPVFIDPGMGRVNLLAAIKQVTPEALIGIPLVHLIRLFFRSSFKNLKILLTTGKLTWGKMQSLTSFGDQSKFFTTQDLDKKDLAAILFTSGGTGVPKGVEYTHSIFNHQTDMLQEMFNLTDGDVDLPGFPLFSFFTMSMGMTSVIPDMDPSKPAKSNPAYLIRNIKDHKASFVAGSPAIWERVADYCHQHQLSLPSVKFLVMFGAPVSLELHQKFSKILPNGTTYTPYGATESLPVANASGKVILESAKDKMLGGSGTSLGRPVMGIDMKIIKISDAPLARYDQVTELPANQIGEIIIKGPIVTKAYHQMNSKTVEAKIYDGEEIWHRIGDIGYFDEQGELWFCGRKSHRVEDGDTLYSSIQCEAIFNQHPEVKRSALIGLGKLGLQEPALFVERKDGRILKGQKASRFKKELLELGKNHSHTLPINKFYSAKNFPVDVRHNIKIDRLKLKSRANAGASL
ncbi:MAG: AMP-binding protein [Halobacteriovoraceae bacterium]|nr:AMP-binding protein [Halobacteriovoraceae bacterium]